MSKINGISNTQPIDYNAKNNTINKMGSESFASYLEESINLDEIFERASIKYNVPVNLLKAIGKAESDFRPNIISFQKTTRNNPSCGLWFIIANQIYSLCFRNISTNLI
jgi:hypothetical protein